jgi:ankyrin repeat protein
LTVRGPWRRNAAMASKTRMTELVKALDVAGAAADLDARPDLLPVRDERGRTWLHLTAAQGVGDDAARISASLAMAEMLLDRGLDMNDAAFTEGENGAWRATPLWYAVAHGRNLALAAFLLERGCDPEHSIWAAAYNRDVEAIRLLRRHGASLSADGDQFLWAVSLSHFESAEELLRQGADPNAVGKDGRTALHMMLKKGSEPEHLAMLIGFGARTDIPGPDGKTAAEILSRKRDPAYRALIA